MKRRDRFPSTNHKSFLFIYLLLRVLTRGCVFIHFRGRGRKSERKRNTVPLPPTRAPDQESDPQPACAFHLESNPQPFCVRDDAPSVRATQPGGLSQFTVAKLFSPRGHC